MNPSLTSCETTANQDLNNTLEESPLKAPPPPAFPSETLQNLAKPCTPPDRLQFWERQPGETESAYADFLQYRDMGPSTTLEDFAQASGKTISAVWSMSSRNHWIERSLAWQQHLARAQSEQIETINRRTALLWSNRNAVLREKNWHLSLRASNAAEHLLAASLRGESKRSIGEISQLFYIARQFARDSLVPPEIPGEEKQQSAQDLEILRCLEIGYGHFALEREAKKRAAEEAQAAASASNVPANLPEPQATPPAAEANADAQG